MKRKVTIKLTVEQAAKIYDLLGAGMQDLCNGYYYSPQQEATADRAYDIVTQALREAFGGLRLTSDNAVASAIDKALTEKTKG